MIIKKILFTNTKLFKDPVQYLFGGCLSHHLSQGVKSRSDFEGNELERGPLFQALQGIQKVLIDLCKCGFVTDIGHDQVFR
jgi:hypothetical protein